MKMEEKLAELLKNHFFEDIVQAINIISERREKESDKELVFSRRSF